MNKPKSFRRNAYRSGKVVEACGYFQRQFRVAMYKHVVDQHMIHRNGRKLLRSRRWRMLSWNRTHSPQTQTNYPTYRAGTMWRLGGWPMSRPSICSLCMAGLSMSKNYFNNFIPDIHSDLLSKTSDKTCLLNNKCQSLRSDGARSAPRPRLGTSTGDTRKVWILSIRGEGVGKSSWEVS